MVESPKCKGCDMVLKWPKWTGKPQRPVEPNGQPHDCPNFGGNKSFRQETWVKLKREDLQHCKLCDNWLVTDEAHKKYPLVNYTSVGEHNTKFHPNGEILDEIDFMGINDDRKSEIRIKTNRPKRTKPYD